MTGERLMENEKADDLTHALGTAITTMWSRLPTNVQHELFEAAVKSAGEGVRERLAIFLHHRHPRTSGGAVEQSRQVPTPDSLGG